ncbi:MULTISPECIES: YesL family protein [Gracilibacillus]|uniref:YesL family protein n=1 Tax=Gracilibacillus TaxID=74385 RepID=UPI00082525CA|nr:MULTISPECIES: DUF624 domain-containing protein [Gracilibacillus]
MEWTGISGRLYRVCDWLMRLLRVNLIWLTFNFPIVYLSLAMLYAKDMGELYWILFTIIALLPFTFFPATVAMFALVRRAVMHRMHHQLLRHFWLFYRQNYGKALLGGLVITLVWGIWLINYQLLQTEIGSPLFYTYLVFTVFLLAFSSYFMADTVHVQLRVWASFRKALLMSLSFPHYTISSIGISLVALYMLYQIHPLFLMLYGGIIPVLLCFLSYYLIFIRAGKLLKPQME